MLKHIEYLGVIPLVVSVTFGHAFSGFIDTVITDLLMPVVSSLVDEVAWEDISVTVGTLQFPVGHVLADGLHLAVLTIIVIYILRKVETLKDRS